MDIGKRLTKTFGKLLNKKTKSLLAHQFWFNLAFVYKFCKRYHILEKVWLWLILMLQKPLIKRWMFGSSYNWTLPVWAASRLSPSLLLQSWEVVEERIQWDTEDVLEHPQDTASGNSSSVMDMSTVNTNILCFLQVSNSHF